jgi:hypothetical protein
MTMTTPPPSKNKENQDAATRSQSQPSSIEEVEARAGRPVSSPHTAAPDLLDDATQREEA